MHHTCRGQVNTRQVEVELECSVVGYDCPRVRRRGLAER